MRVLRKPTKSLVAGAGAEQARYGGPEHADESKATTGVPAPAGKRETESGASLSVRDRWPSWAVRALMALAVLAIHQLRHWLASGADAGDRRGQQEHGYLVTAPGVLHRSAPSDLKPPGCRIGSGSRRSFQLHVKRRTR